VVLAVNPSIEVEKKPNATPLEVWLDEETSGLELVLHTAPLAVTVEPPLLFIVSLRTTDEPVISESEGFNEISGVPCAT